MRATLFEKVWNNQDPGGAAAKSRAVRVEGFPVITLFVTSNIATQITLEVSPDGTNFYAAAAATASATTHTQTNTVSAIWARLSTSIDVGATDGWILASD